MEARSVPGKIANPGTLDTPRRYRVYLQHPAQAQWWFSRRGKWAGDFAEAISFDTYRDALKFCRGLGLDARITGIFTNDSIHLADHPALHGMISPRQCG